MCFRYKKIFISSNIFIFSEIQKNIYLFEYLYLFPRYKRIFISSNLFIVLRYKKIFISSNILIVFSISLNIYLSVSLSIFIDFLTSNIIFISQYLY